MKNNFEETFVFFSYLKNSREKLCSARTGLSTGPESNRWESVIYSHLERYFSPQRGIFDEPTILHRPNSRIDYLCGAFLDHVASFLWDFGDIKSILYAQMNNSSTRSMAFWKTRWRKMLDCRPKTPCANKQYRC